MKLSLESAVSTREPIPPPAAGNRDAADYDVPMPRLLAALAAAAIVIFTIAGAAAGAGHGFFLSRSSWHSV